MTSNTYGPNLGTLRLTRVALAAAIIFGGVETAQAQSSVTLYGVADAGFSYVSNARGKPQYALTSGNENGPRWGLTGKEDLGGDLKAVFTLEGGYSITNGTIGQNGTFFGRQAFVGLANSFGTLTLGRQYSNVSAMVGPFSAGGNWAAGGAAYGAHPADMDNLDSSNRINNSVKFVSSNYHGFTFGTLYSFGGKAGDFTQNQVYDVGVSYANGPFAAAVAYMYAKNPNYSFIGTKANDSATAINSTNPIISGYLSAGSEQIVSAGTSYKLGSAIIGAVYSYVRFNSLGATPVTGLNATSAGYRGSAAFNIGEVSLKYYLTPALMLGAAYSYTRDSGASASSGAHYNQVDLGAIYSLSKRTSLYLVGVYQAASGTNSTGSPAVSQVGGASTSSSDRQTVATFGILHKF